MRQVRFLALNHQPGLFRGARGQRLVQFNQRPGPGQTGQQAVGLHFRLVTRRGQLQAGQGSQAGTEHEAVDKEGFKLAVKSAAEMIVSKPICQNLAKFGTGMWVDSDHVRGSMPTFNYRQGAFEKYDKINGKRISELAEQRKGKMGHRCMPTCVVRCSTLYNDVGGQHVTSGLEYETLAMLGANLGIDDLDAIAGKQQTPINMNQRATGQHYLAPTVHDVF